MGAIGDETVNTKLGVKLTELSQSHNRRNTIEAGSLEQTQKNRQVQPQLGIMDRQKIPAITIKPSFMITIPTPAGRRIRKAARATASRSTRTRLNPIRTGASINTSTIAGHSQGANIAQKAQLRRRQDTNRGKNLLKQLFGSMLKTLTLQSEINKFLNNARVTRGLLLAFSKPLMRLAPEVVQRALTIGARQPQPVNQIIMITDPRHLIETNPDHNRKQRSRLKLFDPVRNTMLAQMRHQDKRPKQLGLMFSGSAGLRIKRGEQRFDPVQIEQVKLRQHIGILRNTKFVCHIKRKEVIDQERLILRMRTPWTQQRNHPKSG